MLNKKVETELIKQVNEEMFSAYLYLSMSAYFMSKNLTGFANWLRIQYQEESFHAHKMFDYILNRGGDAKLLAIAEPGHEWHDVIAVFAAAYAHEQHITARINHMMGVATEAKDFTTVQFLQWLLNEQLEEEANASGILEELKLVEGKGAALLMLDREMKARVFNPPVAAV